MTRPQITTQIVNGARVTTVPLSSTRPIESNTVLERRAAAGQNPCTCCGKNLRNPRHVVCAACAEDMGYARRAR